MVARDLRFCREMTLAVCYNGFCGSAEFQKVRALVSSERQHVTLRRRALKRVDRELSRRNYKSALSLVKQLQGKPGGLRGFGAAGQVPRKLYALEELRLDGIDTASLQLLVDSIMDMIEKSIQFTTHGIVSFEGLESLMQEEANNSFCEENHLMCLQHEAGHFLVGYLLGILPRGYMVPSIEAFRKDKFSGGKVEFVGLNFLDAVDKRGISSKNLNRYSCMTLAGLIAEYLVFRYSEGLHSDVDKLDKLLRRLGFTVAESKSHMRWAVLNTVQILRCHHEARSKLAESMSLGRSVGFCIDTVENALEEDIRQSVDAANFSA